MAQHKSLVLLIGLLALPGMVCAGYPDVAKSHWAHDAVDKLSQLNVMAAKPDGRFHGDTTATRYEVAAALARIMAEVENRLMAEGKNPEDIVPYIERINLYVADEIDALKQSQKEMRARLNEIIERLERRESLPAPVARPPTAPMAHPYKSTVPMTELHNCPPPPVEQKVHPVSALPATVPDTHLAAPAIDTAPVPVQAQAPVQIQTKTSTPSDAEAWKGAAETSEENPADVKTAKKEKKDKKEPKEEKATSSHASVEKVFEGMKKTAADTSKKKVAQQVASTPKTESKAKAPAKAEMNEGEVVLAANEPTEEQLSGSLKAVAAAGSAQQAAAVKPALSSTAQNILAQLRQRRGSK